MHFTLNDLKAFIEERAHIYFFRSLEQKEGDKLIPALHREIDTASYYLKMLQDEPIESMVLTMYGKSITFDLFSIMKYLQDHIDMCKEFIPKIEAGTC